jgi:hypothetical protein
MVGAGLCMLNSEFYTLWGRRHYIRTLFLICRREDDPAQSPAKSSGAPKARASAFPPQHARLRFNARAFARAGDPASGLEMTALGK